MVYTDEPNRSFRAAGQKKQTPRLGVPTAAGPRQTNYGGRYCRYAR